MRSLVMYKPTNRQVSLFNVQSGLSESLKQRLKGSWADQFQGKVLPILLESEEQFSVLYSDNTGRPNWSIARLLGICILQEMHDMDDQTVLDSVSFDIRFQHALGLTSEDAYLSRRSLVEFRSRLAQKDAKMSLMRSIFEKIGEAAIKELKISPREQRLDSTLVQSNIMTRGRVELFAKTLSNFLKTLTSKQLSKLNKRIVEWHTKPEKSWFGKTTPSKRKKELSTLASWLCEAKETFKGSEEIASSEAYAVLVRLLEEHCEVAPKKDKKGNGNNGDGGADEPKVTVRKRAKNPGTSLQSPYDPDAGCGYKGPGYSVQIAETCKNNACEIITDFDVTSAGENDFGKASQVLCRLQKQNCQPKTLYADGGYASGQEIVNCESMGTRLHTPLKVSRLPDNMIGRDKFKFDKQTGLCISCPRGHAPMRHGQHTTYRNRPTTLHAFFRRQTCESCDLLGRCLVRAHGGGNRKRSYRIEIEPYIIARDMALAKQKQDDWHNQYSIRSGIEASASELKRKHGMGKLRVRRLPRVKMAVSFKITACNVKRWLRQAAALAPSPLFLPLIAFKWLFKVVFQNVITSKHFAAKMTKISSSAS